MSLTVGDSVPELAETLHPNVRVSIIERFLVDRFPKQEQAFEDARKVWFTMDDAMRYTKRSKRTIQAWGAEGQVASKLMSDGSKRFNKLTLAFAKARAEDRVANRRFVAGPGRGHTRISPA